MSEQALLRRRPLVPALVAGCTAVVAAVAFGVVGSRVSAPPDLWVTVSDDAYAQLSGGPPGSGAEPWLAAGAADGRAAITYLKFRVGVLPGGVAPRRAELRLTRAGGPLPPHVELVRVPSNHWGERSLSRPSAPRLGTVVGTARPDPLDGSVAFDVTRVIRATGTYSFAVTAPAGEGLALFLAREADRSLKRLRQPLLWLSAVDRDLPRDLPSESPSPSAEPSVEPSVEPSAPLEPSEPPSEEPEPSEAPSQDPSAQPSDEPSASPEPSPVDPPDPGCAIGDLLVPTCGVLWGVAPRAHTDTPRPVALREFEERTGRPQAVYHAYHRGTAELFPTATEIDLAREPGTRRVLFLNWKPTGASWAAIARGDPTIDSYVDRLAEHIKASFPEPFFFTVHHEPENDVRPWAGSGWTATDYAAMCRYVVQRLRAGGVSNLVSVMAYMAYVPWNVKPWFADLYPGDDVVDWVAWDAYAYSEPGYGFGDFAEMMNRRSLSRPDWPGFYNWAALRFPEKPLMVAEWGVWSSPRNVGHKAYFYGTVGEQVQLFPRVKALVYFDTPRNAQGMDSSVDSTAASLEAYRTLSANRTFQVSLG